MENKEIAQALAELGSLMEIAGENRFKINAHLSAARSIEALEEPLETFIAKGRLTSIKGIGKGLAEKITAFHKTGELSELVEIRAKIPEGVIDMLGIHGVGPKKVRVLWQDLGVTSLGELEYACNENRLVSLPGFGEKSQTKILSGIHTLMKYSGRRLLPVALKDAEVLLQFLLADKNVIRADIVGSLRRKLETVSDINIVASSNKPEEVMRRFVKNKAVSEVISHETKRSSVRSESGIPANLTVVADNVYPTALCHFTGSTSHVTNLAKVANKGGFTIDEAGLFDKNGRVDTPDEQSVYKALGVDYIHPELREGRGEVELAEQGKLPKLVELPDITGVFHCHTLYSDGRETVETMAKECKKLGYGYLGISDHSRAAFYAGGLSIDDLKKQGNEIDTLNESMKGFTIFKGVESDILADGSLDYPDDVLGELDFVVVSVHSRFTMTEKEMTHRIVTAIKNPYTTMLGHMTGRLLLAREPYAVDSLALIEACAKHDVIIELNANPQRLDIDWRMIGEAIKAGVTISINPDAHRVAGLQHMAHGVTTARKGGCSIENIYNTYSVEWITADLEKRKKR